MPLLLLLFFFVSVQGLAAQYDDDYSFDEPDKPRAIERENIPQERGLLANTKPFVGSNFGLSVFRSLYVDVSPYVGVRIADVLALGLGGTYIYNHNFQSNLKQHIFGGRAFARLRPIKRGFASQFYLCGEYEVLNMLVDNPRYNPAAIGGSTEPRYIRYTSPALHVGAGRTSEFGKGFAFTVEVLYNLYFNRGLSFYTSPISFRVGVYYGF